MACCCIYVVSGQQNLCVCVRPIARDSEPRFRFDTYPRVHMRTEEYDEEDRFHGECVEYDRMDQVLRREVYEQGRAIED